MTKFADIHCHSGLHPFAYKIAGKKRNNNVWDYDPPKDRQRDSKYPEYTQADFTSMAKGGVKLIYVSIYPIEQGWFDPAIIKTGFLADMAAKIISRVPVKFINMVQSDDYKYFDFFTKEYDYLLDGSGKLHDVKDEDKNSVEKYKYVMLKPGDDINAILQDDHTIGVIVTAEGAQSFISGNEKNIENSSFKLDETIKNIEDVKKWDCPPFFISMSHHFYNGLCGHTRSLPAPASVLLKQTIGLNEPINAKGKKVIDCLLALNEFEGNGPRILIDTKHMSVAARQEYYAKVREFNDGKADPDKIPIVVSHTAYADNKSMTAAIEWPDTEENKYKASGRFNNWSINLSDDEIMEVFNSNGIMGLNFDERILAGFDTLDDYQEAYTKRDIKRNSDEVRDFWAQQMLENILGIVDVVKNSVQAGPNLAGKAKIWDMIAIGTDFDGMINPEDAYITAEEFGAFREKILKLLSKEKLKDWLLGLSPDQVVDKIMYENAFNFAKMYYLNP
jgi:hypothetical protein